MGTRNGFHLVVAAVAVACVVGFLIGGPAAVLGVAVAVAAAVAWRVGAQSLPRRRRMRATRR
ncbi:hypothetical protein [Streptomyces montanisoli]|uniref:Uncharacterized protein n=1 Tax=Streptomyces montanisoli TaxID=2798581 RepID=A0A940MJ97_9ACTN|nr:hypothetical protein [Streptomyces montanisoli]MBP0460737.1 hypothetical protein [Streptomyces montanisoli]